jgi:hypothetical protein
MSCPCESAAPCVQEAFVTVPVAHTTPATAPVTQQDGMTNTACFDCGLDLGTPVVLAMILTILARTIRRFFGDRLIVGRLDRLSGGAARKACSTPGEVGRRPTLHGGPLLHSHALGQVPGLVDVAAPA